jgi:glycosyltransferase involved in cell wall biosynthesis
MKINGPPDLFRIGIVSGKLGDVDGVSLEVDKWIGVLQDLGHTVYTIAGKYTSSIAGVPEERQMSLESIRFNSPEQKSFEKQVFPHMLKDPPYLSEEAKKAILHQIEVLGNRAANAVFGFIQDNDIDVLITENTNAMPMTLVGGMAVYKLAMEKRMAAIFHHHDFWWERSRFSHSRIEELLSRIMPPVDPALEHVVLSSYAAHILSSLKRVVPKVIPNCENFDNPVTLDDYNSDFRTELGFSGEDILVIQPTRIVKRKRIEDSIELLHRLVRQYPKLKGKIQFIISLYQGDEPDEDYIGRIKRLAEQREIPLHMISRRVASERKEDEEGRKMYTNRDVLANADLVTYLPVWEGFGNALLEAIAARKPLVTTTYLVYKTDIRIAGFRNVEIRDNYDEEGKLIIPDYILEEINYILSRPEERESMVEWNFELAKREFSIQKLRGLLHGVIEDYAAEIQASRKRIEKSKKSYSV